MPATTSTRSSPRLSVKSSKTPDEEQENISGTTINVNSNVNGSKVKGAKKPAAKKKSPTTTKRKKTTEKSDDVSVASSSTTTKESPKKRTKKASKRATNSSEDESEKKPAKAKKAKEPVQSITERDELPKLWNDEKAKENGSYTFRIASWNVAGLRAILRNDPDALAKLVTQHNIDVLCLQETKLQEMHLDDPKLKLRGHLLEAEGYDAYYSCSSAKKGYAGTAVFVKKRGGTNKPKQKSIDSFFGNNSSSSQPKEPKAVDLPVDAKLLVPEKVSLEFGVEKHDGEGRVIVLDFPGFTMANLYVPNSGQKLVRLDYRINEWDKDLVAWAHAKQKERGVPVMWLGDLNVAHKNLEAYNFGAKHLDKQAGLTPQERASFQEQLDSGFIDAFRHLHPTAKGHYTYWSQRAGNREPNKGLRLDYFVCDPSFFQEDSKVIARDSYMIKDQMGSDHCPVVLELEIKP